MNNSDRAELRERPAELKAAAECLDALLSNGRRLPAIPLAKATVDIDRMADKLQKAARYRKEERIVNGIKKRLERLNRQIGVPPVGEDEEPEVTSYLPAEKGWQQSGRGPAPARYPIEGTRNVLVIYDGDEDTDDEPEPPAPPGGEA